MAGVYDITCDQGATLIRTITWKQPDGSPVDLTGYTARMHVRESAESDDIELAATTENGRLILGDADGTVQINIESTAMELIAAQTWRYDLELIAPTATPVVTRLVQGKLKVTAEVTR